MKVSKTLFGMLIGFALALVCTFTGCGGCQRDPADNPEQQIKILLDWKADPTYFGFYLAVEKGFFRKRGLSVEIQEGNGASTSATVIGSGDTYLIGSCSGEAAAIAKSKGVPIRSLAILYPDVPTVLYSRADNPIRKPADMIGKRIGLIDGSINVDEYRGLLAANNIDRSKIEEVGVGWDAAPLLTGQVDALMTYAEMTPVDLKVQGHDIVVMRFSDFGVKAYSLNLVVNERLMNKEAKAIRAAVDATLEGYEYLRAHPQEAAEMYSRKFPERNKDFVRESTKIVVEQLGKDPVGRQTRKGWTDTIKTLKDLGLIKVDLGVDDVVAPGYLAD